MRHAFKVLTAVTTLAICSAAMADQIDNPEYKDWAKYKEGTSITMKQASDVAMPPDANLPPGMDMSALLPQTTTKTALKSIKQDELTLEITTTTTQMGQSRASTSTKKVPAKIDQPTTVPATMSATTQGVSTTMKAMKEGKETIEVSGKKIEAVTHEYDADSTVGAGAMGTSTVPDDTTGAARGRGRGGMSVASHIKVWNSSEVPGGLVKMESSSNVPGMGDMKTTMQLIDFTPGK